jgi:hypothetical protein
VLLSYRIQKSAADGAMYLVDYTRVEPNPRNSKDARPIVACSRPAIAEYVLASIYSCIWLIRGLFFSLDR